LVVRRLAFEGNHALSEELLAASIATTRSSWFATFPLVRWADLGEKRYLDEQQFRRDVLRLVLLYRRSGFLEATVDTVVRRTAEDAYITFRIEEGPGHRDHDQRPPGSRGAGKGDA
jgi:outer membrane protein assembly factor BamA